MSLDLNTMKKHCIEVDKSCEIGTEKEIKSYYEDISFKKLLHIYTMVLDAIKKRNRKTIRIPIR